MGQVIIFILFIAALISVGVFVDYDKRKTKQQIDDKVVKTKLITTTIRHEHGYEYSEATFMLYYKDGTHEAKTIDTNNRLLYDAYMSKLEV